MQIYFNPLDVACKSKIGGVAKGEKLQLNLFLLKDGIQYNPYNEKTGEFSAKNPNLSDCKQPKDSAFLRFNKDGEEASLFKMEICNNIAISLYIFWNKNYIQLINKVVHIHYLRYRTGLRTL